MMEELNLTLICGKVDFKKFLKFQKTSPFLIVSQWDQIIHRVGSNADSLFYWKKVFVSPFDVAVLSADLQTFLENGKVCQNCRRAKSFFFNYLPAGPEVCEIKYQCSEEVPNR